MDNTFYYHISLQKSFELPLERFLPPLANGVVSDWFVSKQPEKFIFLDALGSNPILPIEIAEKGARVFVSRHNPVLWLMLETLARSPDLDTLSVLINRVLLSKSSDGKTLEEQIKTLYGSFCSSCGKPVQPSSYLWRKGEEIPFASIYQCENCGEAGEHTPLPSDLDKIVSGNTAVLTRTHALKRVNPRSEYEETSLKNAIECYSTRALFVINILMNRLIMMTLSKQEKLFLECMLFSVFEDALSIWHWPMQRSRPLQLSIPNQYYEKNLYMSLIEAPARWVRAGNPLSIGYWQLNQPPEGDIIFFNRHLAEKHQIFDSCPPDGMGLLFAHPNQAFWTLSALWAGWLWGKNGAGPMRAALLRRHYDWVWYHNALNAAVSEVSSTLKTGIAVLGILTESTPPILCAILHSMQQNSFQLSGHAQRQSDNTIQLEWKKISALKHHPPRDSIRSACLSAIKEVLTKQGEPISFQEIITSVFCLLAEKGTLPGEKGEIDSTLFTTLNETISELLNDGTFSSGSTPEQPNARWWIDSTYLNPEPLSERVEKAVIRCLEMTPGLSLTEFDDQICKSVPTFCAPSVDLIQNVLESYALVSDSVEIEQKKYQLRVEEMESSRQADINTIHQALTKMGKYYGFGVSINESLIWADSQNKPVFQFLITTHTSITNSLLSIPPLEKTRHVLVIPGSRVRLLLFRIKQDARLAQLLRDWTILKFRYARWLSAQEDLSLNTFEDLLGNDPAVWDPTQKDSLL